MLKRNSIAIFLVFLSTYILQSNGDRTKDKMYEKIHSTNVCYRRMNATHQIGCSSKREGSIGVVHYCDTIQDLDFILKNGTAGTYIPILPTKLFNSNTVKKLVTSQKISGIILHPNNESLDNFSHEGTCPNNRFSVSGTCNNKGWNPLGTGLLYADIPFPMFYVEDEGEILKIKECFHKFNNFSYKTQRDRSLCSLELKSFMYATTNTPTCKRRSNIATNLNPVKLCDPLGDSNVWASLFPLVEGPDNDTKPIKDNEYIVIAARMDTTSLFEKTSGAENPVTGMVTLLTVAKILKEMLPQRVENVKKNVLFILFNGETYDYIGSQRMLFDMEHGSFPVDLPANNDILPQIYPENITLFVELSQLAKGDATYVHYYSQSSVIESFISKLQTNNQPPHPLSPTPNSLPPSSLHTFIRRNTSIQGLVLTNHKSEYRNHFYNSIYDNQSNILYEYQNGSKPDDNSIQKYVEDVSLMIAKSVYEEITGGNYTGDIEVHSDLIDELFHCYLEDPNCKVHKAINKGKLPKIPVSLYVGVEVVDNFITSLTALTLAWFTGDVLGSVGPNCTNNRIINHAYRYYNMSFSMDELDVIMCYKATVNMTEAVSPAFIIPDYDWSSNQYSSWSESTWQEIGVRMFLKPSAAHETMTIAIGSMSMIFSIIVVYFMKTRYHILFISTISTDVPANC